MFKKVNVLLNKTTKILPPHESPKQLGDEFASYFNEKVEKIYQGLESNKQVTVESGNSTNNLPEPKCTITEFDFVHEEEILKYINESPGKTCLLDPIPTWFMKKNVHVFYPIVTDIVNGSLSSGTFPDSLKHAVVSPIIKKRSLKADKLKNYRPVSNIPYVSKVVEKFAINNITRFIKANDLGEIFQSAYKSIHSTETALHRVKDDIMKCMSQREGVCLVLLDLSSAFDTVSHKVLLRRLADEFGVQGSVLQWVESYLTGRTTRVCIDGVLSEPHVIRFGLPQGSIVGPSMFTIYTHPIGRIIRQFGISYHMYADDIQLYISFNPKDPASIASALHRLTECIKAIKIWMNNNMLKLNDDKTEFMVITPRHLKSHVPEVSLLLDGVTVSPTESVRNLGVIFDSEMSMAPHVRSLCTGLNFQLRNLSRIRRFLDYDTSHLVTRSIILQRLDYCNGLLLGCPKSEIQRLQRIQNWAAKVICKASKWDHVTPYLQQLHWLPIEDRITFKILVVVFKCLNDLMPGYLTQTVSLHEPARPGLRSESDTTCLFVHNTRGLLKSAESRSFTFSAPNIWNSLPKTIRESPSLSAFKKLLKTHLYPA